MLVIRNEQVAAFEAIARSGFTAGLVRNLAEAYPRHAAVLGNTKLQDIVQAAIELGKRNGIGDTGALAVLAELMLRHGLSFELSRERDFAMAMLTKLALPPAIRVAAVRERLESATQGRLIVPAVMGGA